MNDYNEEDIVKAIWNLHDRTDGLRDALRETTAVLAAVTQILVSARICTDAEMHDMRVRMIGELDQAEARGRSRKSQGETNA